jgi:hypothetical protein
VNWSDYFYYDESSPSRLRWKIEVRTGKDGRIRLKSVGDVAGSINDSGYGRYWRTRLEGKDYAVHRIIWELVCGEIPSGLEVDHKDGDSLNNSPSNLRTVDRTGNMRNKAMDRRNKSGVAGVCKEAQTRLNGVKSYFWVASARSLDGRRRMRKSFAVNAYGDECAFKMACEHREKMIEQLNKQGAGYTERHGEPL